MQTAPVIVILGPTASGKSAFAVELARKIGGEVISADSRQVYKGLDIGTGKITKREMKGVPHHLHDIASPRRVYTASDFVRDGQAAIADIQSRGKVAILCGGTGFYIDALLGRISLPQVPANKSLRSRLQKKSAPELFALLQKKDPKRAAQMDTPSERNNKVRLIRALEVSKKYQGLTLISSGGVGPRIITAQWIGIARPQENINSRIAIRLKRRLRAGMVSEARRLHAAGLSYKRMECLGLEYRSLSRFLQGTITRSQLESELLHDICAYSKRQITYWKRNDAIRWLSAPVTASQAIQHLGVPKVRKHVRARP